MRQCAVRRLTHGRNFLHSEQVRSRAFLFPPVATRRANVRTVSLRCTGDGIRVGRSSSFFAAFVALASVIMLTGCSALHLGAPAFNTSTVNGTQIPMQMPRIDGGHPFITVSTTVAGGAAVPLLVTPDLRESASSPTRWARPASLERIRRCP